MKFQPIRVDLYNYKDSGSLTLCVMIQQETGCQADPGVWGGPYIFHPDTQDEYDNVKELLDLFEFNYI